MTVNIITPEDLQRFKEEFFAELTDLLKNAGQPQQTKWIKSDQVKKLLRVSPGTLQTLRINGTLQYSKIGAIIYYDAEHIQKMLTANLKQANPSNS